MSNESAGWKNAVIQSFAGGSAGFIEVALMHPLDLVKTRMQLQKGPIKKNDPNYYTGILDCFQKLQKQEGTLAFWKGLLPPLIVETPTKSIRFTAFHHYKKIFSRGKEPNLLTFMMSGYWAGITESFVICPFDVVKVTQQSNRGHISHTPSSWKMAGMIIQEGGILGKRGIYRGLGATLYLHSVFCAVYLGVFYSARSHIHQTGNRLADTFATLALGVATGSFACLFNTPFDVVKSRIQAPQPKKVKYSNTWQSIFAIVKEEGLPALYKGLSAKVLRLGPGGAIMIIVFESIQDVLTRILLK
ncbi:mitochondrial 2-oxodicarboxylate carrier-like [Coccinella septempunctata]|uniref:mitochondrial 2-oxodicarboxylate carrier-like n=1 Tax=Coccinella septempunctata TaxID=41139 RepID=UPI001D09672E|nr:mitochondrial 2-oxodicarboxylate carrier-like [Coccinella septempunctata]